MNRVRHLTSFCCWKLGGGCDLKSSPAGALETQVVPNDPTT
jgi:hypothetical protein